MFQVPSSKFQERGFTLIEIIIYTAIVSVILAAIVNFAWNIIYGGSKTSSWQEVQQNTRFAMERITQAVRSASGINSPSRGNSANFLSLQMANPDLNPTVFDVSEDKIYLRQGTSGPYELTTDELEVTNLNFTNLSYADTSGTIRIEMTIEHKNPGEGIEYEASIDMASTVSLRSRKAISIGCWGIAGTCNPLCLYLNYSSINYYNDPGCSALCSSFGTFYLPSGGCSSDGTGACYRMWDPLTKYTICTKGDSCEGICEGTCTPCSERLEENCHDGCSWTPGGGYCESGQRWCIWLDKSHCKSCPHCSWWWFSCSGFYNCSECETEEDCSACECSWQSEGGCSGTCTPCSNYSSESSCTEQLGCSWTDTKWNWNLSDLEGGYNSYTSCQWIP